MKADTRRFNKERSIPRLYEQLTRSSCLRNALFDETAAAVEMAAVEMDEDVEQDEMLGRVIGDDDYLDFMLQEEWGADGREEE